MPDIRPFQESKASIAAVAAAAAAAAASSRASISAASKDKTEKNGQASNGQVSTHKILHTHLYSCKSCLGNILLISTFFHFHLSAVDIFVRLMQGIFFIYQMLFFLFVRVFSITEEGSESGGEGSDTPPLSSSGTPTALAISRTLAQLHPDLYSAVPPTQEATRRYYSSSMLLHVLHC